MGMQTKLDNFFAKNKEYRTQLLTLQDRLIIIHANLDYL
jgi:hypothetical protein